MENQLVFSHQLLRNNCDIFFEKLVNSSDCNWSWKLCSWYLTLCSSEKKELNIFVKFYMDIAISYYKMALRTFAIFTKSLSKLHKEKFKNLLRDFSLIRSSGTYTNNRYKHEQHCFCFVLWTFGFMVRFYYLNF